MAASSSAKICCFKCSSIPLFSNLPLVAAVPNEVLVEDKAVTPDLTFF